MFEGLLSPVHLIVIFAVAMLIFGPKRLPDLGRSLGSGLKEFKAGLDGKDDKDEAARKLEEKSGDSSHTS